MWGKRPLIGQQQKDAIANCMRSRAFARASPSYEIFARKVLRTFGIVTHEDIANEARAITRLCMNSEKVQVGGKLQVAENLLCLLE